MSRIATQGRPPPPPSPRNETARPPMPVTQLPSHLQSYARSIDDGWGNRDGSLDPRELDAFARLYGHLPEHRQSIATLKNLVEPTGVVGTGQVTRESLEAARKLVKWSGHADTRDVNAMVAEVAKLPLPLLARIKAAKIKFVVCQGSVTDHLSRLRGQAPRGWPPGVTWDTVPGLYWPANREVVIATRANPTTGARELPPAGAGHGSFSIVGHELMHALDYQRALGDFSAKDTAFLNLWSADRFGLPSYLAQNPPAGPEEAFAELGSRALLGDTQLSASAPNMTAYFARMIRELGLS